MTNVNTSIEVAAGHLKMQAREVILLLVQILERDDWGETGPHEGRKFISALRQLEGLGLLSIDEAGRLLSLNENDVIGIKAGRLPEGVNERMYRPLMLAVYDALARKFGTSVQRLLRRGAEQESRALGAASPAAREVDDEEMTKLDGKIRQYFVIPDELSLDDSLMKAPRYETLTNRAKKYLVKNNLLSWRDLLICGKLTDWQTVSFEHRLTKYVSLTKDFGPTTFKEVSDWMKKCGVTERGRSGK